MVWNPNQYLKFGTARMRPALDLVNRAVGMVGDTTQVKNILDLGCGTGNISELLCRAFPNSQVICCLVWCCHDYFLYEVLNELHNLLT